MATITTLRPSATSSGVGWSASSGTLHGATSDDNDATYAQWSGSGSAMILSTPVDAPPTGERRHLVRVRARGEDGSAWWAVRLASGSLIAGAAGTFGGSPETVTGSWQAGAPQTGNTILSAYVAGQDDGVRIVELYIDVDTREAPGFTPQVLDGSGSPTVTVSDTVSPTVRASSVDLDGLSPRQYRYWVTSGGSTVWDTGVVSGPAPSREVSPLPNGAYTFHAVVWSTLGSDTAYSSAEEALDFTMTVGAVPTPDPPSVTPETPFFRVSVCAPNTSEFDGDRAWVQVQRRDCPHGGWLDLDPVSATPSYALTPSGTHLDVAEDLDVRADVRRSDDWRPEDDQTLVARWDPDGDDRSWRLAVDHTGGGDDARAGRLFLAWSPDGTEGSVVEAYADERVPLDAVGRAQVRATLDVDNESGGWTARFLYLDDSGQWSQIGGDVEDSGTTSIYTGGSDLTVGSWADGETERFRGRVFSVEVRDGIDGGLIASPDFTGHFLGSDGFTDGQGNPWIVVGSAFLASSQNIVTVAILGPLESAECADWVDYTIPRSGVGRTCDHDPEPCCSTYRARTVGRVEGSVLVSGWSDAFNPGVSQGVVFMWPGSVGTIPLGWNRATDLDGMYVKGAPDSVDPGSVGGSATHSHQTPGHSHDVSHFHAQGSGSTGSSSSSSNYGGPSEALRGTTHTHPLPTSNTSTTTVSSAVTSPNTSESSNDPDRLSVVFIESSGILPGVPEGALSFMADDSPSGWSTYDNATGRFLKGAPSGQGGGAVSDSELSSHSHEVSPHTHGGSTHSHISGSTGGREGTITAPGIGGTGSIARVSNTHTHPVTVNSGTTSPLSSNSGGSSGTANPTDPPFRNLRVRQNTSGGLSLPIGLIGIWRGLLANIPSGWELCDGSGGTPDMRNRFARGSESDVGDAGGTLAAHDHTTPTHSHPTTGHSHSRSTQPAPALFGSPSGSSPFYSVGHTHSISNTNSSTPTVGSSSPGGTSSDGTEPLHREVAFIQLQSEPEPPPEPESFCLEWSEDEHLIRTLTPEGPTYARVIGMFEWARERPFTAATGLMGGRFVTSAPPGGRNLRMVAAVESESELATLRSVLSRPLVLISPSDSAEVWAVPVVDSFRVVKIGRIREVQANFVATGPEPDPQVTDVGV